MLLRFIFTVFLGCTGMVTASQPFPSRYSDFDQLYDRYSEHDERCLPYVYLHIQKAKREKRYSELMYAYENGVYYSSQPKQKLQYADSILQISERHGTVDDIARAHLGKGIVYYYSFKKFQQALTCYLKALPYLEKSNNRYLKSKIHYHIGVVKSYLGYSEEALPYFKRTHQLLDELYTEAEHTNVLHNLRKGRLNTIHQMAVCYGSMKNLPTMDSLLREGFMELTHLPSFTQELGYLYKTRGLYFYLKGDYTEALQALSQSLLLLKPTQDFAWISYVYYYLGRTSEALKDTDVAYRYYQKNDSLFNVHHFLHPEVRPQYEYLIAHAKAEGKTDSVLYYTEQLLKADRFYSEDFKSLSRTLHEKIDLFEKQKNQNQLEKRQTVSSWIILILLVFLLVVLAGVFVLRKRYPPIPLRDTPPADNLERMHEDEMHYEERPPVLSEPQIETLLLQLRGFEERQGYLSSKLTLPLLAQQLHTNSTHLSYVINTHKGMRFSTYLKRLRIGFITQKLYEDPHYRLYTVETLAHECGILSRQTFTKQFQEVNGQLPKDFIRRISENPTPS